MSRDRLHFPHAPSALRFSRDTGALLFMGACWLAAIVLVNPIGEFPSVDDWAYRVPVKALVEHGDITFSDWTATNLIAQVFWGALFALPFGASFTTLRISTLVAGFLAAVALYRLVRDADRPISLALLSGLLLLFNPLFMPLAFSFMSDVPFIAAQTWAMVFLLRSLRSGSRIESLLGWLFGLAALLVRQIGFAIPLAYAGAYIAKHGYAVKRVAVAIIPLAGFIAAQWTFESWLDATGKTPFLFNYQTRTVLPTLLGSLSVFAGKLALIWTYAFLYLGLFLLPVSLPAAVSFIRSLRPRAASANTAALFGAIFAIGCFVLWLGLIMPIWPHTWNVWGVGADYSGARDPLIFGQIAMVLAVVGGVLLAANVAYAACLILRQGAPAGLCQQLVFALLGAAALISVISTVTYPFDRYLLPALPWLALFIALAAFLPRHAAIPRWTLVVGGVFLAAMTIYSITSAHNYTAQKRARVDAIDWLLAQGIPRDTIDASWVFNGESAYGRFGSRTDAAKDWFRSRDYVVSTRREADYVLLRRFPVPYWSLWGRWGPDVLVHARMPGSP